MDLTLWCTKSIPVSALPLRNWYQYDDRPDGLIRHLQFYLEQTHLHDLLLNPASGRSLVRCNKGIQEGRKCNAHTCEPGHHTRILRDWCLVLLHFRISHSKNCHKPCTSSHHKEQQGANRIRVVFGMYDTICLDAMRSSKLDQTDLVKLAHEDHQYMLVITARSSTRR